MPEITSLREPYQDPIRQSDAAMMGMYVLIATEMMLFGGLFLVIAWLRYEHPMEVVAASRRMHYWLGGLNTAILLTSSACVAIAAEAAKAGKIRTVQVALSAAAALGAGFILLKAQEYSLEYREGQLPVPGSGDALSGPIYRLFMNLYLVATTLHAIHLGIGVLLLAGLAMSSAIGRLPLPRRAIMVMTSGLYWHFVDVIWVFLYPLLYLAR